MIRGEGRTKVADINFPLVTFRCNGLRGWFPSNYVEIIEDEPEMIAGDFGLPQSPNKVS